MNVFIVTFVYYCILFHITSIEKNPSTFNKEKRLKSNLYMDEAFLSSYKQEKIQLILNEHNKYRDLHSVPRLVLDRNMNYEAEIWAELLTGFGSGKINHHINYGENIWIKETENIELFMNVDHLNPVREWYSQIVNYTGSLEPAENTRGFTQLVWKSSRTLGVGFAYSALVLYVVCYYDPPGNMIHNTFKHITSEVFRANVHPPKNSTVKWLDAPESNIWIVLAIIITILTVALLLAYSIYHHIL